MSQDLTASPSVLDNKATFRHFLPKERGQQHQKNSWLKSLYRYLNCRLAQALEDSSYSEDPTIRTAIIALRYCSSMSLVSVRDANVKVVGTSKSCRNKYCYICNRSKSTKLSSRLIRAIVDDLDYIKGYHFYFINFTLRHGDGSRTGDYLSDLKSCQNKLFRSKMWKGFFGSDTGMILGYENSIKDDYHIHCHGLLFAPKLTKPVNDVQAALQAKWHKISGDSWSIVLDLIGRGQKDIGSDLMRKKVAEIFKYSTKMSVKTNGTDPDLLAQWILSSKHRNFTTARGLFRGLQLTGHKSRLDEPVAPFDYPGDLSYFFERTSRMSFNHTQFKFYTKEERRLILKDVFINKVREDWECTNMVHDVKGILEFGLSDGEVPDMIDQALIEAELEANEKVFELPKHLSNHIQMELFERAKVAYQYEGQKRFG